MEDAVKEGYTKVTIRTVDTDVVVLAVASAQRHKSTEVWVADRCIALPVFHAFTGCDTVSCFGGRSKRTAWDTWRAYEDVTIAFCSLATIPESIEGSMKSLERFVILMYDRTRSLECVNQARKQLFTQKGRSIEAIPPTKAALIQQPSEQPTRQVTAGPK